MGIMMIALGIILLAGQVYKFAAVEFIIKWWPVILVILGIEVLAYVYTSNQEEPKVKFDVFSIFLITVIMIFSMGAYAVTMVFGDANFSTIFPAFQHYNYESTFTKNIAVDPKDKTKLILENKNGNVRIEKGSGDKIEVEARIIIRNNDEELARAASAELVNVTEDGNINVRTDTKNYLSCKSKIKSINVDYTVKVPEKMNVETDNSFGDTVIENK